MYEFAHELLAAERVVIKTCQAIAFVLATTEHRIANDEPLSIVGTLQALGPQYDGAVARFTALREIQREIQQGRENAEKALRDHQPNDQSIVAWIAEDLGHDRESPFRPRSIGWRQVLTEELARRGKDFRLQLIVDDGNDDIDAVIRTMRDGN